MAGATGGEIKGLRYLLIVSLAAQAWAFPCRARGDVVQYEVIFDATWSRATHSQAYPSTAHFSGLIGGTHNPRVHFWQEGQRASPGIKRMAETGSKTPLDQEVQTAIDAGNAFSLISGGGISHSPGTVGQRFDVSSKHPLVSVVSMIAPSPDWFVGTSGLNLRSGTKWLPEVTVPLEPYDAGTDSGAEFESANSETLPPENVQLIDGPPFRNARPLGTFTFQLVSLPGDLNASGEYDPGDVDLLCANLGSDSPRFEFTGNDQVNGADVAFLVNSLMKTRAGDANLDGQVAFDDFLALSNHFGQAGTWSQGDFNCSGDVRFSDFLVLAANFGFQRVSTASVTPVPEPSGSWYLVLGCVLLTGCLPTPGRRRRVNAKRESGTGSRSCHPERNTSS